MGETRTKQKINDLLRNIRMFKSNNRFDKIILFGSYARGDFTKDSDVDLIIIDNKFRKKNVFHRTKNLWINWHIKQKLKYPVDFLCYTPEEFEKLKKQVSIVSEALREGIEI